MSDFKKGNKVKWTSQAAGSEKTKEGVVVQIIHKADGPPFHLANKEFPNHKRMFDGWTIPGGKDKGYFIEVKGGKTPKAKPKLYMPYPYLLELN
jgi:hypothetical protein